MKMGRIKLGFIGNLGNAKPRRAECVLWMQQVVYFL